MFEFSTPGESPPPPPRALFGRDELIEEILGLIDKLTPIALIGAGGIGKTSIALTILHHDRVRKRFGENRRFIRCDQFPPTLPHFLRRLSKVLGAGAENPEDLTSLQPFLSLRETLIVLDNAESILDPQGTSAEEIYTVVEELGRFSNVWLFVTSRISTIPPDCETLDIPTLSMEAARDAFYRICKNCEQSDLVDSILEQLDFHPLSIDLLATVARQHKWDTSRLTREWEKRRTAMLHTHHNKSLAATIELSLTSPMFKELGPHARALLEVVAFFPQGINEDNLDWLFPTIAEKDNILDEFCVLSLTHRSNGFVTMLAPLRDHLSPKDPGSSLLLRGTKEFYFRRLSVHTDPEKLGFGEVWWIVLEDVNVEHLLGVFTSIDADSDDVWNACTHFMDNLRRHKPRSVMLGPKIEGLPDDHPFKPPSLLALSRLLNEVGNCVESKRVLIHTWKLWRDRGDDLQVAHTLSSLAIANRGLHLYKEGIPCIFGASQIYEQLNNTAKQEESLQLLALMYAENNQVDEAALIACYAIKLSDKLTQSQACEYHHILSHIHRSNGEMQEAIGHLIAALGIASSLNLRSDRISVLVCLTMLLLGQGMFDAAQEYFDDLKSYALAGNLVCMGMAAGVQACVGLQQGRVEEAKAELAHVISVYERIGYSGSSLELSKELLVAIDKDTKNLAT